MKFNNKKKIKRLRLTPAAVVGITLGGSIAGIGLYGGIVYNDYTGYFFCGTGFLLMIGVLVISWYKR